MEIQNDFTFSGLTPDTILDAINGLGIYAESGLLALNSYENRVYQFLADDRQRYVVKFYRPARWSDNAIQEEHDFSQALLDADIPVVAPLKIQGNTLHHFSNYRFALFPSVGGRQFELDNLDHLEWMGRFIGRMHRVGQSAMFTHRESFDLPTQFETSVAVLKQTFCVPGHLQEAFYAILHPVIDRALARASDVQPSVIRLHGDCHPGNILWRDGPTFVDLDDARNGPAIQDLWMMLNGDRASQTLQLGVLLSAYEEFHGFDSKELHWIEPLRALRIVMHMAWLAQRWHDPAFPRAFPWFETDKFWEQQILSLKEQLSALDEPVLTWL